MQLIGEHRYGGHVFENEAFPGALGVATFPDDRKAGNVHVEWCSEGCTSPASNVDVDCLRVFPLHTARQVEVFLNE